MEIVASEHHFVPAHRPPTARWRLALREAIRSPRELCQLLDLPEAEIAAAGDFQLLVPRGFAARMRRGDSRDPLLLQVLPQAAEMAAADGFVADPVGDLAAEVAPGLLHKYTGRMLMIVSGACAIHCRYCFRREFPYESGGDMRSRWSRAVEIISRSPQIDEVILSGGDPLSVDDGLLSGLAEQLAGIPHLRRLRIHSRLPVVLPERICEEFLDWFAGSRLTPIMVVHANHPQEIDDSVADAVRRMTARGIAVLNQAVLLRGVNDSADVLAELCRRLVDLRVQPYYLHQLDRVRGAAHFEVPVAEGLVIMDELRAMLPGYAVPKYVQEIAGALNKVELSTNSHHKPL